MDCQRDPSFFRKRVLAQSDGSWIIVDEVQRLPDLLNEVHALIAEFPDRYHFALTGSSARKLKRHHANLLAGRAIRRKMFALTAQEMNFECDFLELATFGCLPAVCIEKNVKDKIDTLEAYVDTYLREEIQQEALVRQLKTFHRFLQVVAIVNAQIVNIANIARDTGVARSTVQGYFSILEDTLLCSWLPAFQPRAKIKEVGHPKFYFFDPGVALALRGDLREPVSAEQKGLLFETYIYHELQAAQHCLNVGGDFFYWRTPSGSEIDFIWKRGKKVVGFEVKSTRTWKSEYGKSLKLLLDDNILSTGCGVYLGADRLKDGEIVIYPVQEFLRKLASGDFF